VPSRQDGTGLIREIGQRGAVGLALAGALRHPWPARESHARPTQASTLSRNFRLMADAHLHVNDD
jgi:hypothetical protein